MPFQHFLTDFSTYKYLAAFLLAIVEGPMVMVAGGMLYRLAFFSFWPIYLLLMFGDFVADLLWYWVGFFGGRHFVERFGKYFSLTPELLEKIEGFFHKHQEKILFISKITMGFGFAVATLFTAGLVRIPFKKYALFNFLGGFIWTGILFSLGYFFGNLYVLLNKGFRVVFIIGLVALMAGALYGAGRYFKTLLLNNKL